MHVAKQIMYYFKRYKLLLVFLYLICIGVQVLDLVPVYLFGNIVDYIVGGDFHQIEMIIVKLVILFIISNVLKFSQTMLTTHLSNKKAYLRD